MIRPDHIADTENPHAKLHTLAQPMIAVHKHAVANQDRMMLAVHRNVGFEGGEVGFFRHGRSPAERCGCFRWQRDCERA